MSPAPLSHTFSLLQFLDLLQHWLDIQKEPVAVAEELQQVPRPEGATRVVNQFPRRGQTIWLDLKFFPLCREKRCQQNEQEHVFSHKATRESCGLVHTSDRT